MTKKKKKHSEDFYFK